MENSLTLNLSEILPIYGQINQEMMFEILNLMECKISTHYFKNYIKKKLLITDLHIEIYNNNKREIILKLSSEIGLPENNQIINHIRNFFSFELGNNLINKYTKRKIIYITKQTGIPLIGNLSFGILLHNTNIIEIRPITGCPLNCIFCSVDEGKYSELRVDYIVDLDYLIEEIHKVIDSLSSGGLEAHISAQGEPTIYPHLINLINRLSKIPEIQTISMQTNGFILSEDYIDNLEKEGLHRINLSINSLNQKKAKQLSKTVNYDIEYIKKIAKYIAKSKIDLIITPIIVPETNEEDIEDIIKFAKEIGAGKNCPPIGIQKYLVYQFGRKIPKIKVWNWKKFYDYLRLLEKKHDIKPLILNKKDFNIHKLKNLPKPFKKGQIIDLELYTLGRRKNQMLSVKSGRIIEIIKTSKKIGEKIKAKIIKTQRNIFVAEPIN